MSSNHVYPRNISFRGLLSLMCSFPLSVAIDVVCPLSLDLPLGILPFILNFITTLNIDSPSFVMVKSLWSVLGDYFLFTIDSLLLCLYRCSFLFLSHLVTSCIIMITFMYEVVICCSSLFVKVQHSLPKIRMRFKMLTRSICLGFFGTFLT